MQLLGNRNLHVHIRWSIVGLFETHFACCWPLIFADILRQLSLTSISFCIRLVLYSSTLRNCVIMMRSLIRILPDNWLLMERLRWICGSSTSSNAMGIIVQLDYKTMVGVSDGARDFNGAESIRNNAGAAVSAGADRKKVLMVCQIVSWCLESVLTGDKVPQIIKTSI